MHVPDDERDDIEHGESDAPLPVPRDAVPAGEIDADNVTDLIGETVIVRYNQHFMLVEGRELAAAFGVDSELSSDDVVATSEAGVVDLYECR